MVVDLKNVGLQIQNQNRIDCFVKQGLAKPSVVMIYFQVDECSPLVFANGHTSSNTPDPIRTRKLSGERPGQYWGGGPPGKPLGCCWLFDIYDQVNDDDHGPPIRNWQK